MDLVLSSHARMRKKDFWRQLFSEAKTDERAVEHLAKLYGSAKYYKPLLSNDKDSDESGNVLQIGSGVENLHTCLIKDHLGGSKLTLAASPAFFKKLGETGHPLPTDGSVKQRVVERDENYWAKLTPAEGGEKYRLIVDNGAMEELLVGISDKKQLSETAAAYLNATLSALKPSGQFFIITMAVESTISEFMRHFCYRTEYSYSCYPMNLDRANDCYGPVLLVVNLSSSDARKDGENGTDASSKVGSSLSQESGEEAASPGAIAAGAPGPVSGAPQRAMVYYDMRATKVNNALGSTESILQIPKIVRHARMTSFWTSNIADYNEGQLWHFEIQSGAGDNRETCYYLSVYDRVLPTGPEREKILKGLKGTITILAPLADQHHWLYKTERGHQRLAERAACRRVICLFQPDFGILTGDAMNPVKALNKIKEDVGRRLIDLSVDKTQAVLLMTQQESYNDERKEVYRTESQHAGRIFVFDTVVDTDDDEFNDTPPDSSGAEDDATKASGPSEFTRRVVMFECNPRQAQTEVWYKTDNGKTNFQYYHVCHAYQLIILGAMLATPRTTEVSKPINAMLIGLGGGMIAMLCRDLFGKRLNLDAVDIDPTIVDIAEKVSFAAPTYSQDLTFNAF